MSAAGVVVFGNLTRSVATPTPFDLEDAELRLHSRSLYELSPVVVTSDRGHPAMMLTCEECGAQPKTLLWCGVRLCLPCWRKQGSRAFSEIVRVVVIAGKERRSSGMRAGVRFVTLTVRSGPELEERVRALLSAWDRLRARKWWSDRVDGCVAKLEVTWNPTEGWHPHLHALTVGSFIPSAPSVAREGEGDLRSLWAEVTIDGSSVVHVRDANVRGDALGFARELAKYLAKPFAEESDGSHVSLENWPEPVRLELARWVRGGERVRWWCHVHRGRGLNGGLTSSRRVCEDANLTHRSVSTHIRYPDGTVTERRDAEGRAVTLRSGWLEPCDGEYRREATGARRLRWYGSLRQIHAEREELITEELGDQARRCERCGRGRLLGPREVIRRLAYGWVLPRGAVVPPLPFIQAHKSGAELRARTMSSSSSGPLEGWGDGPSGGKGPPPTEEWGALRH